MNVSDLAEATNRRGAEADAAKAVACRPAGQDTAAGFGSVLDVPAMAWQRLAANAIEANAYHLPEWLDAVSASARQRTGIDALWVSQAADGDQRLTALMPVVTLWRAYGVPLRALVSAQPYGTLGTPHLDADDAVSAAEGLIDAARQTGARALMFRDLALAGPAAVAIRRALIRQGLEAIEIDSSRRALLDATQLADLVLHDALGGKKLKELRRQRRRLGEIGAVRVHIARAPQDVRAALEAFLLLEASGWKGQRGTALAAHDGDALFIRRAAIALAKRGQCEIATLYAGDNPIAAAIVLRHLDRAFTFKIGYDEAFAKYSPGVQLVLELTRHFCDDPAITSVDSTAVEDHPMIGPIWRGRLAIGDLLIPLRRRDPVCAMIRFALLARLRLRSVIKATLRR